MTKINCNLNDYVWVRLTPLGRDIHKSNHNELMALIPAKARRVYQPVEEDADGWSKWQLWELMLAFGWRMGNGAPAVMDTNIRIQPLS